MTNRIQFNLYATPPHECSYLSHHQATTVFIDPRITKDATLYEVLSQYGFRRSGEHIYRPQCRDCTACVPVRIPAAAFEPRRSQRRIWKRNQDLTVTASSCVFRREHFNLYCLYLAARHAGGGMDNPTPRSYLQFLTSDWSDTVFYEFRLKRQLLGVAVVDLLETGASAVYTFFDPSYPERSLGVYAVLWEIEETKRLGLEYLYLGYWIENCRKMQYKTQYSPLEHYIQGVWKKVNLTAT